MQKTAAGDKLVMKSPSHSSSFIFRETHRLSFLLLLALIFLSAAIFHSTDFCYVFRLHDHPTSLTISAEKTREKLVFGIEEGNKSCDIFSGRWMRDYNRPLYQEWECPYITEQTTCITHGRPEKDYLYWRWQPHGCSIPSFDARMMLERLRGKRMMFVGDSLNRAQFISLICLLHGVIPQHAKSIESIDMLTVFTAKDYNARIEFYWTPFLLESNGDDPLVHKVKSRYIRNDSMNIHGQHWKQADIIIFNTYIWWVEGVTILRGGSFEDEVKDTVKLGKEDGYRFVMKSLIEWMNNNIDPKKTRVFFSNMAPTHQGSYLWGGDPHGNCYNETKMIEDPNYFGAQKVFVPIIVEELSKSQVPITILNITQLSSARKDAHTSIYKQQWKPLTDQQKADPKSYADCIHWCLPGLPDIWNELFFAKLFFYP